MSLAAPAIPRRHSELIENWRDVLGEDLAVTLDLPVAPSAQPITAIDAAVRFLDAIAVIEDGARRTAADEPPPPDFERLELKIDLLMYLVSASLETRVPQPTAATISAHGLVLPAEVLGSDVDRVAIYLCSWLPQPLVLAVSAVVEREGVCGAGWQTDDPRFRNALSRWVFRMHRREIARRRADRA